MISRRGFVAGGLALPAVGCAARADEPSIRDVARANGFRFGSAVVGSELADPEKAALIAAECDLVTPEYAMKLGTVWTERFKLSFGLADAIADWAAGRDIKLRVHTPVFTGSRIPDWINEIGTANPGRGTDLVLCYVARLAAKYADTAVAIDVVNEAIAEDGSGLRDHWLYNHGGYRVIADAFIIAREAAPDVELVYNDWIQPYSEVSDDANHPDRRNRLLDLIEECCGQGARIDTIGIQSHLQHKPERVIDYDAWTTYLQGVEATGLRVAITELDAPDCWIKKSDSEKSDDRDTRIAEAVGAYLAATLEATSIRDIVCWGLADDDRRFPDDGMVAKACREQCRSQVSAAPYDGDLQRKRMADAIISAMQQAPERT